MSHSGQMLAIGFTGDISFTGRFADMAWQSKDVLTSFDPEIITFLTRNSWNVGNIEGALTTARAQKKSGVALKSPPESAALLKRLKINCYNLANNHAMDCGLPGLEDTFKVARQNGAVCLGAGRDIVQASQPLILEQSGIRVGLLAVAHNEGLLATRRRPGVFAEKYDVLIRERIRELRSGCDWVILNYHGGEEYTCIPAPLRRNRLLQYLDVGVDVVVAHHSHVAQGYEQQGNKRIFYSLGNFLFDIPGHAGCQGTDESVLISLLFGKQQFDVKTLGTRINLVTMRVDSAPPRKSFVAIIPDDYQRAWQKEAWRILVDHFSAEAPDRAPGPIRPFWRRVLIKMRRALGIMRRLPNPNFRCICAGACSHWLTQLWKRQST